MDMIYHGGDLGKARLDYPHSPEPWIDLSTGINPVPYPWLARLPREILEEASARLPQKSAETACTKIWTESLQVTETNDWILVPGSQAMINLLPTLFPDHQAVITDPCYGEYERVWHQTGTCIHKIHPDNLISLAIQQPTVVILTNPNNPDGHIWSKDLLIDLAKKLATTGGSLVIDEAYGELLDGPSLVSMILPDNVIILRSLGKFFGLAGLRLGMVRLSYRLRHKIINHLGPWSINGLALAVATYALKDKSWIDTTRNRLRSDMADLRHTLKAAGLILVGGTDLFCLTRHVNAPALYNTLLSNGILIRKFPERLKYLRFGLPRDADQFQRLKEALK